MRRLNKSFPFSELQFLPQSPVQVSGDADGVEAVVSAVSGVTRVNGREDGKFEFETLPGADPRPEVARALVQAGYDLLEMRSIGVSLEDIFLQLTRDEPAPLEPAGDDLLDSDLPDRDLD